MKHQQIRNHLLGIALCGFAVLSIATPSQAQNYEEGKDFVTIAADAKIKSDGKVDVMEFFWFGCPSCFRFEPTLLQWNIPEEISFSNVPAAMVDGWVFHAHVYYAMDLLKLKDVLMQKFYDEIHVKRKRINDVESFQKWAAAQDGVDAAKLTQTLHSFAAKSKVAQAEALAKKYGVNSVPTLVVGHKYRTSPAMAGSDSRALEIVEYLARRILEEEGG
ncbi:MAG: thiol:disulfide interchange protein DsbA/DsbL [Acidiferrobacterales bacterium]|nr:thiol:disulfide interchange protein DsbA/DsbL [Acidiferrobacterales bacterium]